MISNRRLLDEKKMVNRNGMKAEVQAIPVETMMLTWLGGMDNLLKLLANKPVLCSIPSRKDLEKVLSLCSLRVFHENLKLTGYVENE